MIGPKCQLCGKQRKYHGGKELACPIGKKLAGAFFHFHVTDTFQAKPPNPRTERPRAVAKSGGSRKRKDVKTRRAVKAEPCVACKSPGPCDPAHIRGWKVGQCDADWNITSLCRPCHELQHRIGVGPMFLYSKGYADDLTAKGWQLFKNFNTGKWTLFNEKEVALNLARRGV